MTISEERLAGLRADTPACENIIHFNNAGASLMPDPVFAAVTAHLERERMIGGYEAAMAASENLAHFYAAFGELLRVQPAEIAYVENATRAWDMAFYALPLAAGDRIITHESEYASNYLAFLQLARRRGIAIDIAPSDPSGQVDVDRIAGLITPNTRLIALTHVPTQGGLVNPAAAVGRIAREHDLIYLLDACQSVGQIDVDVSDIGCHLLSGTGRKFLRGPRGTGFLYVSAGIVERLDPPFVDMRAATWTGDQQFELAAGAQRFENWESYVAGRIGLAAAVDYALAIGLDAIEERVGALAGFLRERLGALDGIAVHDRGVRKCGIVTFASERESAVQLTARLRAAGMNISVSPVESSRLDLGRRGLEELARASVHYFNTHDEINRFCTEIAAPNK